MVTIDLPLKPAQHSVGEELQKTDECGTSHPKVGFEAIHKLQLVPFFSISYTLSGLSAF